MPCAKSTTHAASSPSPLHAFTRSISSLVSSARGVTTSAPITFFSTAVSTARVNACDASSVPGTGATKIVAARAGAARARTTRTAFTITTAECKRPDRRRHVMKIGVVGAGNMGAGIAQKYATEGFDVVVVDVDQAAADRGRDRVKSTLAEGVVRKIFAQDQADAILARMQFSGDRDALKGAE